MTTATVSMPLTRAIPLSLIRAPEWNSRMVKTGAAAKKEEEGILDLARSFEAQGQLTPIEVEEHSDGSFELVFGSRRMRAAEALKWEAITANVRPATSAGERIFRNIVENEQRSNLTTFEQARAYKQLRDMGLKNAEIATKLGKSSPTVSNAISMYDGLPDAVLKEWEKSHPVASFDNLRKLLDKKEYKTPADQVRAWDEMVADAAAKEADGGKAGKRGKSKDKTGGGSASYSLVKANVDLAIDLLSPRRVADEKIGGTKAWANQLVQWLIGQRKTPPNGIEFPAKDEE